MTTKPTKPKKTAKNRPVTFDEAIVATAQPVASAPLAPAATPAPRISQARLRTGLIGVWALAVIAAGIGLGLLLRSGHGGGSGVPPVPVAQLNLSVTQHKTATVTEAQLPKTQSTLVTRPALSVYQAQAGTPISVLSDAAYQPGLGIGSLQPGFKPAGFPQGTVGTAAVN